MLVHGSYYSDVLKRKKSFMAVLPKTPRGEIVSVVLLHGAGTDETEWAENAPLTKLADEHDVAFFCPSGENSFYTDQVYDELFGTALGSEFVRVMRRYFSVPDDRAHTAIAGFSMGGYGACRLGLRYPELYCAIGAFSPAFIFYKRNRHEPLFERVFVRGLEGSENDCAHLYETLLSSRPDLIPWIRLRCGDGDPLLKPIREFFDFVRSLNENEDVTLEVSSGFHDFSLWGPDLSVFCAELDERIHVGRKICRSR